MSASRSLNVASAQSYGRHTADWPRRGMLRASLAMGRKGARWPAGPLRNPDDSRPSVASRPLYPASRMLGRGPRTAAALRASAAAAGAVRVAVALLRLEVASDRPRRSLLQLGPQPIQALHPARGLHRRGAPSLPPRFLRHRHHLCGSGRRSCNRVLFLQQASSSSLRSKARRNGAGGGERAAAHLAAWRRPPRRRRWLAIGP